MTWGTFLEPFKLLGKKYIISSLIPSGVVFAIWQMMTSSATGFFKDIFHLDERMIGLAFLANGFGTTAGTVLVGKFMDSDFVEAEAAYKRTHGLPDAYVIPKKGLPWDFPIERARLRRLWFIAPLFILCTGVYGWTLAFPSFTGRRGSLTLVLCAQFLVAAGANAVLAINQTLISDLCPGKGASSTSINDLARCGVGAVGAALGNRMIRRIGVGYAFSVLALISLGCIPLWVAAWAFSLRWRLEEIDAREQQRLGENGGSTVDSTV